MAFYSGLQAFWVKNLQWCDKSQMLINVLGRKQMNLLWDYSATGVIDRLQQQFKDSKNNGVKWCVTVA